MGRLIDRLAGRDWEHRLARARRALARGALDAAEAEAKKAVALRPTSARGHDMVLAVQRARARGRLLELRQAVARQRDADAYARLVRLEAELSLNAEARRTAQAFVEHHADDARAHHAIGAIHLAEYLATVDSRVGRLAHEHLARAARLDARVAACWLHIAQFAFVVDDRQTMAVALDSLERLESDGEDIAAAMRALRSRADASAAALDSARLEQIEVDGHFPTDPRDWPLSSHDRALRELEEQRTQRAVARLLEDGVAKEIAVLGAGGAILAHGARGGSVGTDESGLARVVRSLGHTIHSVHKLDLGGFSRCTLAGKYGRLVVGRQGSHWVAAHADRPVEAARLWDRTTAALSRCALEQM